MKRPGIQIARAFIDEIGDHIADAGFVGRVLCRAAAHAEFHRNQRYRGVLHEPGLDTPGRNQMLDPGRGARGRRHHGRHCQARGKKQPDAPRANLGMNHDRFSSCFGGTSLIR